MPEKLRWVRVDGEWLAMARDFEGWVGRVGYFWTYTFTSTFGRGCCIGGGGRFIDAMSAKRALAKQYSP